MKKELTVKHVNRQIIERKLLMALEEGDQVAILATLEDLETIVAALLGYELATRQGNILSWAAFEKRRRELGADLQRLRREAFPL